MPTRATLFALHRSIYFECRFFLLATGCSVSFFRSNIRVSYYVRNIKSVNIFDFFIKIEPVTVDASPPDGRPRAFRTEVTPPREPTSVSSRESKTAWTYPPALICRSARRLLIRAPARLGLGLTRVLRLVESWRKSCKEQHLLARSDRGASSSYRQQCSRAHSSRSSSASRIQLSSLELCELAGSRSLRIRHVGSRCCWPCSFAFLRECNIPAFWFGPPSFLCDGLNCSGDFSISLRQSIEDNHLPYIPTE